MQIYFQVDNNKQIDVNEFIQNTFRKAALYSRMILLIIGSAMVIAFICVFIVSVFFDADMTTLLYEKYGRNIGEDLKGKVIWITGASTGEADLCYKTVFNALSTKVLVLL